MVDRSRVDSYRPADNASVCCQAVASEAISTQATEIVEPGVCTFDYPTILAEPAAVFGPALRDHGPDAALTQRTSVPYGIVAAIGIDDAGRLKWLVTDTTNRRNCIDERQQLHDVVGVRAGQDRSSHEASRVATMVRSVSTVRSQ